MSIRSLSVVVVASVLGMGLLSGPAHADMSACKANYTTSGNIITGRVSKTYDDFSDVPPQAAYRRVYMYLVSQGWRIGQSDKDLGVISAVGGSGAYSINILIESSGSGSKVSATVNMGVQMGLMDIPKAVCKTLAAADDNTSAQ